MQRVLVIRNTVCASVPRSQEWPVVLSAKSQTSVAESAKRGAAPASRPGISSAQTLAASEVLTNTYSLPIASSRCTRSSCSCTFRDGLACPHTRTCQFCRLAIQTCMTVEGDRSRAVDAHQHEANARLLELGYHLHHRMHACSATLASDRSAATPQCCAATWPGFCTLASVASPHAAEWRPTHGLPNTLQRNDSHAPHNVANQ